MGNSTIAVIDYGIGNVQSVVNACDRVVSGTRRVTSGADLLDLKPSKIILPGVGAIGAVMQQLREKGFEGALNTLVMDQKVPFLGICVGMQMLSESCEEFGTHKGLGWIPGGVSKLDRTHHGDPEKTYFRIPHVGWNSISCCMPSDPVMAGFDGQDFYFLHSCHMHCPDEYVCAVTDYGGEFISAVRRDNILGVQFHPEKSSGAGNDLIRLFVEAG